MAAAKPGRRMLVAGSTKPWPKRVWLASYYYKGERHYVVMTVQPCEEQEARVYDLRPLAKRKPRP